MNYLNIKFEGTSPSGKTKRWVVENRDGYVLGHIIWFAAWRRYTFFPDAGTTFDSNCLREIAMHIVAETSRNRDGAPEPVRRPNCF